MLEHSPACIQRPIVTLGQLFSILTFFIRKPLLKAKSQSSHISKSQDLEQSTVTRNARIYIYFKCCYLQKDEKQFNINFILNFIAMDTETSLRLWQKAPTGVSQQL